MKKKLFIIAVTILALTAVSLFTVACNKDKADAPKEETTQAKQETTEPAEEKKEDIAQEEEKAEDKKEDKKDKDDKEKDNDSSDIKENKTDETGSKKAEPAATKKTKSKKSSAKKTKKVWVEPVYETHTVDTGLGTTYCNGANSGGGCGASWHGTKEATYQSWKSHWQAYVKRRTAEEAAKGKTYVCDHIHDDCRWVADPPKQEKVLVKKGYWKTVSE